MPGEVPLHGLPRRRNGKPQSCEPCRKAKTACDHGLPQCHRCIRKEIVDQCTYHPAPLTGAKRSSRVTKSREASDAVASTTSTNDASNLLLLLSRQRSIQSGFGNRNSGRRQSSQFLGPTSYSAVLSENQASLGETLWGPHQDEGHVVQQRREHELEAEAASEQLKHGMEVFRAFPSRPLCLRFLDRYFSVYDAPHHEPSLRYCLLSIFDTSGAFLKHHESLAQLSETVLRNSYTPTASYKTAAEWLESFSGGHLRFEVVGSFLAIFGLAVVTLAEEDSLFTLDEVKQDRRQYVHKLGLAAERCQLLCSETGIVNEFTVWMMHHLQILQSLYSGDDSENHLSVETFFCLLTVLGGFFWRKAGHVATSITALGHHRESTITDGAPFMVSELRKRMFVCAFIADKQLATFTGRPPRLSRRYCNCHLPLDLDDTQLTAEGDELSRIIGGLNVNGWNTEDKVMHVTILRAYQILSLVRDEVLELCLGTDSSPTRRDEVKKRNDEAFNQLPNKLRFDQTNFEAFLGNNSAQRVCTQLMLKLEFLLSRYLLERLHTDYAPYSRQAPVDTAIEMLDIVLLMLKNRDRLSDYSFGWSWIIVYFGIPSAGALCIELLKQNQYPQRYALALPRSDTIQNLSTFVFCLTTIRPSDGNYTTCTRMRQVLRRILDQILEPVQPSGNAAVQTAVEVPDQTLPDIDISSMMGQLDDGEFVDWLNSVDWTRGPWTESI